MAGHKFTGWYFTYPSEEQHLGLVSTISDDPPALNWIFVDKDSYLVRHGGRQDTLGGHIIGPWNWTGDEQWLTLKGDDSQFVAVELEDGKWAVAWDGDGTIRAEDDDDETEESELDDDEQAGEAANRPGKRNWLPIRLHRRLQLGMESRYVKGSNG